MKIIGLRIIEEDCIPSCSFNLFTFTHETLELFNIQLFDNVEIVELECIEGDDRYDFYQDDKKVCSFIEHDLYDFIDIFVINGFINNNLFRFEGYEDSED